ncbi:hypothetical protein [Actinomadura litoris]|uniref:hypothetical protein n=1 Tax=Actinomadura litoris TaxID=2678616 RepID=UPI001FA72478|nr:hypothetical protein [Actinomadura litoris]
MKTTTKLTAVAAAAIAGASLLTAPPAQANERVCGGWHGSTVRHRGCAELSGNRFQPEGDFINSTNRTLTFSWAIQQKVNGGWITCAQDANGRLGPHASWTGACSWRDRPATVRTLVSNVRG